jgi:hypothetical protein
MPLYPSEKGRLKVRPSSAPKRVLLHDAEDTHP